MPLALGLAGAAIAADGRLGLGTPAKSTELGFFFAIPPNGRGLPPGSGTARQGEALYARRCAGCHGVDLQGDRAVGGDALVGGRATLAGPAPLRTVESYWPYATTLFDYVKRSMPFNEPGVLTDSEVYSVVAYILAKGGIVRADQRLDADSLPRVRMPNRDGFEPSH